MFSVKFHKMHRSINQ